MSTSLYDILGKKYDDLAAYGAQALTPSQRIKTIVADDSNDLPDGPCRGIWSGTDGTVNLVTPEGDDLADFPIFAGLNPIAVARVKTGGTATNLYALY